MSTLGIAIVNYLGAGDTAELVRSIVASGRGGGPAVAIAIVDNSDQREQLGACVELAVANGFTGTVIHGHGNVGYAAGNNLAAAWLLRRGAEVIWVLNPDTRLAAGTLADAMAVLDAGDRAIGATGSVRPGGTARPGLGALSLWTGRSGRPVPGRGRFTRRLRPLDRSAHNPRGAGGRLSYVAGHSLLATRRAWLDLGGFAEDFFLFFEEADLAVRAAAAGIATTVVPELVVEHAGGAATGATADMRAKSLLTYYHASRSCMIFFRRHLRRRLPVAVAARLFYAQRAVRRSGAAAAAAVLRGTIAGLRA